MSKEDLSLTNTIDFISYLSSFSNLKFLHDKWILCLTECCKTFCKDLLTHPITHKHQLANLDLQNQRLFVVIHRNIVRLAQINTALSTITHDKNLFEQFSLLSDNSDKSVYTPQIANTNYGCLFVPFDENGQIHPDWHLATIEFDQSIFHIFFRDFLISCPLIWQVAKLLGHNASNVEEDLPPTDKTVTCWITSVNPNSLGK
jgi:hypothetical protein